MLNQRNSIYLKTNLIGSQALQLTFDAPVEDKAETPGELPDPEKGGLSGTRPLGMSSSSNSLSAQNHPPSPSTAPPPPPQSIPLSKKPSTSVPPPQPPKLDPDVSSIFNSTFTLNKTSSLFLTFLNIYSKVKDLVVDRGSVSDFFSFN